MKIVFNGLGANETVVYDGKIYRNGSVVDTPEAFAKPYLSCHLATEVKTEADEREAEARQRLERKNTARRSAIREKAEGNEE